MGRPSKKNEVKGKLLEIITRNRAENEQVLPGERELAALVGVSRSTVRNSLDELEKEGVISRENQMTRCLPLKKQRGRYAYCAASNFDCRYFFFGLYQRLWNDLRFLAGDLEIDLVFIPQAGDSCPEEILKKLAGYDLIFVSYIRNCVVRSMIEARLPLVMLDEENKHPSCPLTALDNRMAGQLAASKLAEAGCRNALIVEYRCGGEYRPFSLRREGFIQTFEASGGRVQSIINDQNEISPLECLNSLARAMEPFLDSDIDSVFYLSDESTSMLNWYWFSRRNPPVDLKIISFLGCGEVYRYHPLLDHVAMDNMAMVSKMLYMMELFEKHRILPEKTHQLVPPVYHAGETISNLLKQENIK